MTMHKLLTATAGAMFVLLETVGTAQASQIFFGDRFSWQKPMERKLMIKRIN